MGKKERRQREGSTFVSKIGYWLEKSWEWGPKADNRLETTTVTRIFLRVKTCLNRASERFRNRKDIL